MSHDFSGVLLAIHIAREASAPMEELDAARLPTATSRMRTGR